MTESKSTLMIVEDDAGLQNQLKWFFSSKYEIVSASGHDDALAEMRRAATDVVILDLGLPPHPDDSAEGFRTLTDLLKCAPGTRIVVLTGFEDTTTAVKAVSLGAWDFICKPADPAVLGVMVDRAFHLARLEEISRAEARHSRESGTFGMITANPAMQQLWQRARKIARTDVTCLIRGESGTGKEVFARAIHDVSTRAKGP
ncbi:MAG: response regulator, partial [Pseudomonadales bacterium]|nr:response regulator [Pseudomonadales bacterium]